jgi:hypothetical protein
MSSDSETLLNENAKLGNKSSKNTEHTESDFPSMGVDLLKRINFKVSLFLFLFGLFILSDIFIDKFLPVSYQDGTNCPNSSGTVVQLIVLIICYIIVDLLVQGGIL